MAKHVLSIEIGTQVTKIVKRKIRMYTARSALQHRRVLLKMVSSVIRMYWQSLSAMSWQRQE